MNDFAIKGEDVDLFIYNGSDYVELLCAKSCSITISTEQILKTTVGNGVGIKRAVRRIEWGVSFSGVNLITSDREGIYSFDLLDIDTILSGYLIKMTFSDPSRNGKIFTGRVFLNSATLNGAVNDFSDSDFDMIGDGIYDLADDSDSPDTGESPESPDTVIPFVISAIAISPTRIRIEFSESMTPLTISGWSFKQNGSNLPTSGVDPHGADEYDFFVTGIISTDVLLMSYNSATGNTIDESGNELESFTDEPVTNETGDVTAPTIVSATAINATTIQIVFDEVIENAPLLGWSFKQNGGGLMADMVTGHGTITLNFTMGATMLSTDTILMSYDDTLGGTTDANNNQIASFTDQPVTNSIP